MSGRTIVTLSSGVLTWARERTGDDAAALAARMRVAQDDVLRWEQDGRISVARARKLARATHTPEGFLFLAEPPDERLSISDFRAPLGHPKHPSPDLIETVYLMKSRVAWMREERIRQGWAAHPFVGSCRKDATPETLASALRDVLSVSPDWASRCKSPDDGLATLRDLTERAGILPVFNGIVGNNTNRKLDRSEFQGFAIADEYAPLVFVNNADFKRAQVFTFAHELVHLVLGASGVSRLDFAHSSWSRSEHLCNAAAAAFLVPGRLLDPLKVARSLPEIEETIRQVAKQTKVSTVVVARRAADLGLISRTVFLGVFEEERAKWQSTPATSSGGSFWTNQKWRIGPRFAASVFRACQAGRLSYTDAFELTGLKGNAFFDMPKRMGLR